MVFLNGYRTHSSPGPESAVIVDNLMSRYQWYLLNGRRVL